MTLCKRKTISATSCDHMRQRVEALIKTQTRFELKSANAYHTAMVTMLAILEQSPIEYLQLSELACFCDKRDTFTPFEISEDERFLYNKMLREEGLSPLQALVLPAQERVERVRREYGQLVKLRA